MRALVVLASLVVASAALAGWTALPEGNTAGFHGKATGGLKLVGTTKEVSVVDDGKTVTVTVPLANVTTGIALRDRHMKEKYLDVAKHPTATLVVPVASLPKPGVGPVAPGSVKGVLTIKGVAREVAVGYSGGCRDDGVCDVHGEIPIDIRHYGIVVPSYLGVTVKPDVTIVVDLKVKRT